MAGSNSCEVEKKEKRIKIMQADSRVGRRRALQILAGEQESPDQTLNHTPHTSDAKWTQKRREHSTRGQ